MMTAREVVARREAIVMHPNVDRRETYWGENVYSITGQGLVISVGSTRLLYPWSRVTLFKYDQADEAARKVIQGF